MDVKLYLNLPRIPNEETAAICGLFCGTCTFYPDHCHGCLSDKLTAHCITCPNGFRDCAKAHDVTRCYECVDFPCERLQKFKNIHFENGIGHHLTVIIDLLYMKEHGVMPWVEKNTAENLCPKCGKLIYWMDKNCHCCD
ncbi:MAG: DUF3795 domain-containing protein [Filifactoraceae bacterium]